MLQASLQMAALPRPSLGAELMTALDVVIARTPAELPAARANAAEFARRYAFQFPAPELGRDEIDSLHAFRSLEAPIFAARMRPIFSYEVSQVAASGQVVRHYNRKELIHADIPAAVDAGLLERGAAEFLFQRVERSSGHLLEFASLRTPENPYLSRRWVWRRLAADIAAFGAVFAFTREPAIAAAAAGAFALKLEGATLAAGRYLARRSEHSIAARIAELECAQGRAREQLAALNHNPQLRAQAAQPRAVFAEEFELADSDLVLEPILD